MRVADIAFDCQDPQRLAEFWAQLMLTRIAGAKGPYVVLKRPNDGAPRLVFQRVETPSDGKNRVHLDLTVADLPATEAHVIELGGRRLHDYDAGGFLVMADPEGNVFCLLPEDGEVDLDDAGVAQYH